MAVVSTRPPPCPDPCGSAAPQSGGVAQLGMAWVELDGHGQHAWAAERKAFAGKEEQ